MSTQQPNVTMAFVMNETGSVDLKVISETDRGGFKETVVPGMNSSTLGQLAQVASEASEAAFMFEELEKNGEVIQ